MCNPCIVWSSLMSDIFTAKIYENCIILVLYNIIQTGNWIQRSFRYSLKFWKIQPVWGGGRNRGYSKFWKNSGCFRFKITNIINYLKIYIHHRIIVSIFSVIYNIIIFLYNRTGASDLAELQNTKEINGKYGCFANIVFLLQGLDH